MAPDRLLRCVVVLKRLKGWSFRELESELRHSLLYRRFTRFFEDPIPDFTSFSRPFGLFGAEGTRQLHQRVLAQGQGTEPGSRPEAAD
jgi:IS5 family transposase